MPHVVVCPELLPVPPQQQRGRHWRGYAEHNHAHDPHWHKNGEVLASEALLVQVLDPVAVPPRGLRTAVVRTVGGRMANI